MKILLLVSGGRGGSDFFQSLLDGHPQVLQFPGTIKTNKKLIKILSSENPNNICKSYFHCSMDGLSSAHNTLQTEEIRIIIIRIL